MQFALVSNIPAGHTRLGGLVAASADLIDGALKNQVTDVLQDRAAHTIAIWEASRWGRA